MNMLSAPGGLVLLLSVQILLVASSPVVEDNSNNTNQRELVQARGQRCNFINDLSNGEDERACGACQFEGSDPRQECGLELWADESLHWSWFELPADVYAQVSRQGVAVKGTLKLSAVPSQAAAAAVAVSNLTRHRAGIYFPSYRPTDSKSCKFTYAYRPISGKLAHHSPPAIIKTVLVATSRKAQLSKDDSPAEVQLLDTFVLEQPSKHGRQREHWIAINSTQMARSTWTISIIVETKQSGGPINSNDHLLLLELTDFMFSGCEPSTAFLNNSERQAAVVDLDQVKQQECPGAGDESNSFICRLSGRCIYEDYRCDFGHDCGPFDFSDEHNCPRDLYQGRCNFEHGPEQCGWSASPVRGHSWLWSGQANGNSKLAARPPVLAAASRTSRGNFMLVNMNYWRTHPYTRLELLGPRVHLRPGHQECHFRFWAGGAKANATLYFIDESIQVSLGERHVGLHEVFHLNQLELEKSWHRFQVSLFDSSEQEPGRLRLSFGTPANRQLPEDTILALDDFSFSPGCELAHHEQAPLASLCPPGQFTCARPSAHDPEQVCLPANRVCDFKDDCGRDPVTGLASDELLCRRTFDFARENFDASTSGLHLNEYGDTGPLDEDRRADAFWVYEPPTPAYGPLRIVAQPGAFRSNLVTNVDRVYSTESGVILPRFSQAHANCSLRLNFSWEEARNLTLNIYLIRGSTQRILLRQQNQHDSETPYSREMRREESIRMWDSGMQSMEIGIGQQDKPFNVHVEISFDGRFRGDGRHDDPRDEVYSGEFKLWSYEFVGCNFPASRVAPTPRLEMHNLDDLSDTDEYQYSAPSPPVNLTCPAGHFQCGQPVLCLPERLVCDMQRDCQESNADELDCTARGYLQFDFESDLGKMDLARPGLIVTQVSNESQNLLDQPWRTRTPWGLGLRHEHGVGPAMDHTRRSSRNRFLTLAYQGGTAHAYANQTLSAHHEATLTLGRFKVANSCKRLVVYAHIWPRPPIKYEFRHIDDHEPIKERSLEWDVRINYHHFRPHYNLQLDDVFVYSKDEDDWWRDGWRRIELELPHMNTSLCANCSQATQFSITFRGEVTTWPGIQRPLVAFDDLVLGPKCELVSLATTTTTIAANRTRTNSVVRVPIQEDWTARSSGARHKIGLAHPRGQSSMTHWFVALFGITGGGLVLVAIIFNSKFSKNMANIKYWRCPT